MSSLDDPARRNAETVRLSHDKWENGPSDWGFVLLPLYEQAPGNGPRT